MTDKQIAATVRFGRQVTVWPVDHAEITGYIAGMDRYNYFILEPVPTKGLIRKYLIHKAGLLIELHEESSLDSEPETIRDSLRKIVVPFRTKILDEYYPDLPRRPERDIG